MENSSLLSSAEWNGLISSAYGELYSELAKAGARYFERIKTITTIAATNATGTLTCDTKANLVDGETFTLNDGYGQITFELDVNGTGVTAGRTQVDISGDTTAEQVEATCITAINAATHEDGTTIAIGAASGGSGIVALTHDETGEIGNQVCSESSASTLFAITDMTGGGQTYRIPTDHLSTLAVYYVSGSGQWLPLREVMTQEYHKFSGYGSAGYASAYSVQGEYIRLLPFPASGQTYKFQYLPQNPDLSGVTDSYRVDVVTPDGEEFIVAHVAVNALAKEDSDVRGQVATRERMRQQVAEWATMRSLLTMRSPMVDDQLMFDEDIRFPRMI